ncbi:MAG: PKD domain-containing protein [Limnohabitans sp.]
MHTIHTPKPSKLGVYWLKAAAMTAMLSLSISTHAQRVPQVDFPPMPQIQLPVDKAQGSDAINLLGDRLPEVARAHGMSPAELQRHLSRDKTLWIDRKGRLFYIEEAPQTGPQPGQVPVAPRPDKKPGASPSSSTGASASTSLALTDPNTFLLHSRPGAKRTIYLDFNGHSVSGTAWNSSYGLSTITSPAFDLNGSPNVFESNELAVIRGIWQRVAEDYAPFDVDITTEEPAASTLLRSTSSDDVYGSRVVITKDFTAGTSKACNCGGFAYVGVFSQVNNSYYQPAYVFYDRLGKNEKNVAEAISHEAGHNLGLSHDGTSTTGYYSGQGTGATSWAPIMGVGYYKNAVQWSKGEYLDANNTQDDLSIIQQNGAPLRTDDHADTLANATTMTSAPLYNGSTLVNQSLSAAGVISTASDVDVFGFNTAVQGDLSLTLTGATPSPNLDAQIKLLNANGDLMLAPANPTDALGASLSYPNLPAGQYYVFVEGVGNGDAATTGYSDYGSLGQYQITGTAALPAGFAPTASLSATPVTGTAPLTVTFTGSATDPDGTVVTSVLDFGDATSTSPTQGGSHNYLTAGTYTAKLTVTDNQNLTGQATVQVVVSPALVDVYINGGVTMALKIARNQATASATVAIYNRSGFAVSGLTVNGAWSGAVSGSVSATTGSGGSATFTSSPFKQGKTATFTVKSVTGTGYVYNPSLNVGSNTGSITYR